VAVLRELVMTDRMPDMLISASAPGKLVISGEYAVLESAPAICMAVDRRARVTIATTSSDHHTISAPGISSELGRFRDIDGELEWLAGSDAFALVDKVWRTANPKIPGGTSLLLDTSEFLDENSGIKLGIGSSAALAVALAAALAEIAEIDADARSIAFTAHRQFQGGYGSGIDVACSSAGGLIEYTVGAANTPRLSWPDGLLYALLWAGVAADTGSKLAHLDKRVPLPSRAALVYAAQRMVEVWHQGSARAILREFRDYTQVLREFSVDHELGIFDAGHAKLADAADAAGLVYKPCGAGGGDVGAVFADNAAAVTAFVEVAATHGFRALKMNLDPGGVQVIREKH
jgi:phosphomevalonate kinase